MDEAQRTAHIVGNCGADTLANQGSGMHKYDEQLFLHAQLRKGLAVIVQNFLVDVWRKEKQWRFEQGIADANTDNAEYAELEAFQLQQEEIDEDLMHYDPFGDSSPHQAQWEEASNNDRAKDFTPKIDQNYDEID